MSLNLRPNMSMPGEEAAVGLIVSLCLAVAVALSGCAGTDKEQSMAPTCEQTHDQAMATCQQVFGGQTGNLDELESCQAEATQELEACRSN